MVPPIGVPSVRDVNRQNDELKVPDFRTPRGGPQPDSRCRPRIVALQRGTEMRGIGQPVDGRIDPRLTTSPQAKHNNRSGQLIWYINRSNHECARQNSSNMTIVRLESRGCLCLSPPNSGVPTHFFAHYSEAAPEFLRCNRRCEDGKEHRDRSVVGTIRVCVSWTIQRIARASDY